MTFNRFSAGRLARIAVLLALPLPITASRANNFTTSVQEASTQSWDGAIWEPGPVMPTSGNTYEVLSGGVVRNPSTSRIALFFGNSLMLDAGAGLLVTSSSDQTLVFPVRPGTLGLVLNGGFLEAMPGSGSSTFNIAGQMAVVAPSTIFHLGYGSGFVITAQITGTGNLTVFNGTLLAPLDIQSTNNPYSGSWLVQRGYLLGSGMDSLGTGSITISPGATLEVDYDIQSPGTLTLSGSNSVMVLHQDCQFGAVSIDGIALAPGTYTFNDLLAQFPGNFAPGGSGSITVPTPAPAVAPPVIPSDRLINWTPGTCVGVPGGIPTARTNSLLAITVYGADSNGVSDSSGAINAALGRAPRNTAVFLPAGTYVLSNGLNLANNVTLRGATNTVLVAASTGPVISHTASDNGVNYGDPSGGQIVTGGLLKGSTNITVASTSGFGAGRLINLSRAWWGNVSSNDQYDLPVIVNVNGYDTHSFQGWPEQQMLMTTGVGSTNIFFWPPLYFDMTGRVCVVNSALMPPPQFAGIEDLSINCSNVDDSYVIELWEAYGDWIKNVHIMQGDGYVVSLLGCLQCEIRDSFVDQSYHNGPNGFGIGLHGSSGILVENNIIFQLFPTIEVCSGSSGNVFGYNFCYNTNGNWVIDSNHGPHNRFNLYEGNIANDFKSDGYFGSESHCVQYRNWFHGQYLADTYVLDRFSRQFSLVGNILGGLSPSSLTNDGTVFGLPNLGNPDTDGNSAPPWADWGNWPGPNGFQELDTEVSAVMVGGVTNFIRVGNFNYFTNAIPPSESLNGQTLSNSLYLSSQPSWWTNGGYNMPWPPFDPTSPNPSFNSIPAGYRYLNAN